MSRASCFGYAPGYRWSYNAGFAIAPDTNIGAGSEERIILIPVFGQALPFERDAEELTTSGVGAASFSGAGRSTSIPWGPRSRLRSGANVHRREHGGSDFDEASLSRSRRPPHADRRAHGGQRAADGPPALGPAP